MENAGRLADPTVLKFDGKYYLYLTGGVSFRRDLSTPWGLHTYIPSNHRMMDNSMLRATATQLEYDFWMPAASTLA